MLVPMVAIAVRRHAGFGTYLRMPLHLCRGPASRLSTSFEKCITQFALKFCAVLPTRKSASNKREISPPNRSRL